jgi:hypothetical protein
VVIELLTRFQEFMDAVASPGVIAGCVAAPVLGRLGTAAHEIGHALVGRRYGARLSEVVVQPGGHTLRLRVAGVPLRLGLGLGSEARGEDAQGWVSVITWPDDLEHCRRILVAGPLAEMLFGALALGLLALLAMPTRCALVPGLAALYEIVQGLRNLTSRDPFSDGGRLRLVRAGRRPTDIRGRHTIPFDGHQVTVELGPRERGLWFTHDPDADNEPVVVVLDFSERREHKAYASTGLEWVPTHVDPVRGQLGVWFGNGPVRWDVPCPRAVADSVSPPAS